MLSSLVTELPREHQNFIPNLSFCLRINVVQELVSNLADMPQNVLFEVIGAVRKPDIVAQR